MTCHVALRREEGAGQLTDDQLVTLLELARRGDRDGFNELARCLGVTADRVERLWMGTLARLGPAAVSSVIDERSSPERASPPAPAASHPSGAGRS